MSRASTNVDDADALRAFRIAMGLEFPSSLDVHMKTSEDSDSTTITDVSFEAREQNDSLLYRNEQSQMKMSESEAGNNSSANSADRVDLATTPVNEGTAEMISASQQETPPRSRDMIHPNVTKLAFDSPDGGLRAPQNSPATASTRLSTMARPEKGNLTQEEAHDCVLDIVKELTAFSERTQARKIAAANNVSCSLPQSHFSPHTTAISNPEKIQTLSQPEPIEMEPARLLLAPARPSNMNKPEKFGSNKSCILPHLRKPKERDDIVFKGPSNKENLLPPHLRGLKQKSNIATTAKISSKGSSSVDSEECLKSFHGCEKSVLHESPSVNTHYQGFLHTASDQGSLETFTEHLGAKKPTYEHDEKSQQTASSNPVVSQYTAALEGGLITYATDSASTSSSRPIDITKSTPSAEAPILKTSLTSTFLDKWGSKRKPLFPRTFTADGEEPANLENQLVFKAWPGQTARYGPSAQIRTCHLKGLPSFSTPASVCSIVFGGALERVHVNSAPDLEMTTATVRFLSGDACKSFYDATANGLPLKTRLGSRETIIWVTLGRDVDIIGGLLSQQIEQGVTRCVRAVPVDAHLEATDLQRLATEKGRLLEGFEEEVTQNESRIIIWRFCEIAHAVLFRGVLARKEDFESCNISFSEDPCALREVPDL